MSAARPPRFAILLAAGVMLSSTSHGQTTGLGDWPQLLGPQRDGIVDAVIAPWSAGGPTIRWRKPAGEGFAGPAVVGERLILFHRRGGEEIVEALDTTDGRTLWATAYPTSYRDDFGFDEGPRATPTVAQGRVFTFGAQGVLQALSLQDGTRLWSVDTHRRFGVRKGFFGAACAPLVFEGRVMVNVGGSDNAGIVAFDAATGEVAWRSTDHEASYSAPVIARLGASPLALFFTRRGLIAVDPLDGETGAEIPWRSRSASSVNAATPLVVDGRVFISASYGTGAALLDVGENGFSPVWSSDDVLTNHYATSVYHDGHLYGYHGRQEYRPSLRAVELLTGDVAWSEDGFGGGTLLRVGDDLLILRESGELVLAVATPERFDVRARASILEPVVWAYPAFAHGALYARNGRELVAVELISRQ